MTLIFMLEYILMIFSRIFNLNKLSSHSRRLCKLRHGYSYYFALPSALFCVRAPSVHVYAKCICLDEPIT